MASVHSRMYIPLVHSTSAVSHSVFIRLRVRFDSSHVAYVVHNCSRLYRRRRAETASIRHACAFRDNVDQRGAASRRFPGKKFSDPLLQKVEKGGAPRGVWSVRGENFFSKIASAIAPCCFGPSHESNTGALSIATSQRDATAACTYMDATQAMLMAGRARGMRSRGTRRRSCSLLGC